MTMIFALSAASCASANSDTSDVQADTSAASLAAKLSDPARIAEGKIKFVQTCAFCHGEEGDAGKVRAFRERQNWDPQIIHDTIANGKQTGANVMPSWKDSIPDDLIWKIVAYIKSLEGKPRATN